MSPRYAKLRPDWSLRGWEGEERSLVDLATGEVRPLEAQGFYTALSCDGTHDFDSLAYLPEHRALLDVLVEEGIAEPCPPGDALAPWQRYRKAPNPRLTAVHWCVTGRCNLRCRHCCMEAPASRYGEPSCRQLEAFVDQFERANVMRVALSGGEPFLRPDLMALVALLASRAIRVTEIYTNGLLVSASHLEHIRRVGFDPSFQVSFDGVGGHDRMRGVAGVEREVVGAMERIRDAGFDLVASTCIDRANVSGLVETYELMRALGVRSWRIGPPQESGNWRGTTTALGLEDQARALEPILDRWLADGRPFAVQLSMFFRGGAAAAEGAAPASPPPAEPRAAIARSDGPRYRAEDYDCYACREQCNLLPDGTLLPCPGYVDSSIQDQLPSLHRQELSEVWSRSFLRDVLDVRKRDVLARNAACASCALFGDCGAGCRASAVIAQDDLLGRDPLVCELWREGYRKHFEERARRGPGGRPLPDQNRSGTNFRT